MVEHTSLDQIRESIIAQLEEEGYVDGENIEIDYQNAQDLTGLEFGLLDTENIRVSRFKIV